MEIYESLDDYYKDLIDNGYIHKDGAPKKCINCDNTDFNKINIYKEDYYVVEFQMECSKCKTVNGHWGYGYWQI